MWPNLQETADLVTFTEETLNGKLHFLCSDWYKAFIKEKTKNLELSPWKKLCFGDLKNQFSDLFYLISFYVIYL